MTKLKVSVTVRPQHTTYPRMRQTWQEAEAAGVDSVFIWDHFFPLQGDPWGAHFECTTLLAALAEATERVQLGSLVICNSYRNPNLLADIHRTIDHISGGRVILGIGSGWKEQDYVEYGYDFKTAPERLRDLAAALPVIEERLKKLNPPSLGSMPIMIGGSGEKVTLRLVAQHAQIWNCTGAEPEKIVHLNGVLDEWCAKLGRDPKTIERSALIPAANVSRADEYFEAGITHLITGTDGPGESLNPIRDLIKWRDAKNA